MNGTGEVPIDDRPVTVTLRVHGDLPLCAVEWEWDVPPGTTIITPDGTPPSLVVTITLLEPSPAEPADPSM